MKILIILFFPLPLSSSSKFLSSLFFFNWRKTAFQCCVGFCHRICESAIIIHISSLEPPFPSLIPPLQVITEHQAGLPVLYSNFSPAAHMLMLLSPFIPLFLSLSHHVYKSILYICVSSPSLQISSLILFFQIPYIWVNILICFSLSDLLHSVSCRFTHLTRTDSNSFFIAGYYSIVYIYHIFFIHSSVDGHFGCFQVLDIVNSAAMNTAVHMPFRTVLSGNMPSSGAAGSYGIFSPSFFKESPYFSS